ncbi:MAG: hypothetical protein Q4G45_03125 [Actinomycetia bacterium]|nr:hypothetical protein [Actinomycetes bacterium]
MQVVVVTGPVGAGKTRTVHALCDLLLADGLRVWSVDQDALRSVYPWPEGDRYGIRLGLDLLAACWTVVSGHQVDVVLIADVVESPSDKQQYAQALGCPLDQVRVVRLDVPRAELRRRLHQRESPTTLEWHLTRADELQRLMEEQQVGDAVVRVGEQTPHQVAAACWAALH